MRGRARPILGPVATAGSLAALALVVGLAGCAATSPPAPSRVAPVDDKALAFVERWEADWQRFTGLRASVELTVHTPKRDDRASALLLLSPTALRLEVATPFGLPALVATAGPERVVLFRPLERRALTARPTPEATQRWLGVPLAPETLISLLVGHVPSPDPGTLRVQGGGDDSHLAYERAGIAHQVWVTREGWPARLQIGQRPGVPGVSATFDWTVDGHVQRVSLDAPEREARASVRYVSAEPVSPPPEAFVLALPPDVRNDAVD